MTPKDIDYISLRSRGVPPVAAFVVIIVVTDNVIHNAACAADLIAWIKSAGVSSVVSRLSKVL